MSHKSNPQNFTLEQLHPIITRTSSILSIIEAESNSDESIFRQYRSFICRLLSATDPDDVPNGFLQVMIESLDQLEATNRFISSTFSDDIGSFEIQIRDYIEKKFKVEPAIF